MGMVTRSNNCKDIGDNGIDIVLECTGIFTKAEDAKKHLKGILEAAESIELVSHDKGKFGRILGDLFIGSNETSVNQQMIDDHHAVAYTGGNKEETEAGHMANREILIEQGVVVLETQQELKV